MQMVTVFSWTGTFDFYYMQYIQAATLKKRPWQAATLDKRPWVLFDLELRKMLSYYHCEIKIERPPVKLLCMLMKWLHSRWRFSAHSEWFSAELGADEEAGEPIKPALDGKAVAIAAVSTGDLKAGHGSAEYIQGIENQRAMKVRASTHNAILDTDESWTDCYKELWEACDVSQSLRIV